MKNYIEVRDWLEGYIPEVYGKSELGLARIENLLKIIGNPEKKFKSIHVAGTAGKGSTCFYIARLLEGSGLKVGLHISPHLVYVGERMQINGKPIAVKRLVSLVNRIKPVVEAIGVSQPEFLPSYFEILVALSFLYFAEEKVDIAVVEVGLGGRLDATNVLLPEISVITNIGLDHTELLGDTIEKIAIEKAGIIKGQEGLDGGEDREGYVVVTGAKGKALKVIEKVALSKNARLINIYTQGVKNLQKTDVFRSISEPNDMARYVPYNVNAECALLAITTFLELEKARCFPESSRSDSLSFDMIKKAFSVNFTGRFEEIDKGVIIDGAHNEDKVKTLISFVKQNYSGKKITLVVAFKKGKNWQEMIDLLVKNLPIRKVIATQYFATTDMGKGSAVEAEEIAEYIGGRYKMIDVRVIVNSQEAVFTSLSSKIYNPKSTILLITGSLYLVGEARTLWKLPEF